MTDLKPTVIGIGVSMPMLATIAVALRFTARTLQKQRPGQDDYTILAALVSAIALSVSFLACAFLGNLGSEIYMDSEVVQNKQFAAYKKTFWLMQLLSPLTLGITKMAVILFYKRIFISRPIQITTYVMEAAVLAWTISFVFANLLDCLPISTNWTTKMESSYPCINTDALFAAMAITDILTDVMILVLPWYPMWKLQMPLRRKLSICAIFLFGGFVVAAGIVRLAYVIQANKKNAEGLHSTECSTLPLIWTEVEACVGVVCACLPTLRPLVSAWSFPNFLTSLQSSFSPSYKRHRGPQESRSVGKDRTSKSSLIPWAGPKGYSAPSTTIEWNHMQDIPKPQSGITIETGVCQSRESVQEQIGLYP